VSDFACAVSFARPPAEGAFFFNFYRMEEKEWTLINK
jgi:hypothetical protein